MHQLFEFPDNEDHQLVKRILLPNSERARMRNEALAFLPDTVKAVDAIFSITDLLEEIHTTRYKDVNDIFARIDAIFALWKIKIEDK